jgi:hypothetical protein
MCVVCVACVAVCCVVCCVGVLVYGVVGFVVNITHVYIVDGGLRVAAIQHAQVRVK